VVDVGVAHERAQDAVSPRLVEAELEVLRRKVLVRLRGRQAEQQVQALE